MLQRKGNQYELYPFKVKYLNYEEPTEQWALPNKDWWAAFSEKWSHLTELEFEEIPVTEDMQKRYEEIKDMPEDFTDIYTEYALTGNMSEDRELPINHSFSILRMKKESENQYAVLIDLDFRQTMTEMGM